MSSFRPGAPVRRSRWVLIGRKWGAGLAFVVLLLGLVFPVAVARAEDGVRGGSAPVAALPGSAPVAAAPGASTGELALPRAPTDYSSYSAGWLDLSYHPSLSSKVAPLKELSETTKREYGRLFGREVLERVTVRVARTPGEMATLAPEGAPFPKYASGVAYPALGLILLTATPKHPGEKFDLGEVYRHELLHVALHDAVSDRVPRWFNEGLAVHASGELYTARLQTLWTATLAKRLLPLRELTFRFPSDEADASIAYAEAADIVRYLLRGGEEHRFVALVERLRSGESFDAALSDAYATTLSDLESDWQKDVARRYTFWPILLGGSSLWAVTFALFFWGYAKRKRRAQEKLGRWAKEEAIEDARLALLRAAAMEHAARRAAAAENREAEEELGENETPMLRGDVPRVQHEGHWHTLH